MKKEKRLDFCLPIDEQFRLLPVDSDEGHDVLIFREVAADKFV